MAAQGGKVLPWQTQGGVTNFSAGEGRAFARSILNSETYREWLKERVQLKKLETPIEVMLWHYGFGKPTEQVNVNVTQGEDLSTLSLDELLQRNKDVEQKIQELKELDEAIPAQFKTA